MWKITNTAEDRTKTHLHRQAPGFDPEPSIDGIRLRLGQSMELTDEHYESIKELITEWVGKGMVEAEHFLDPHNTHTPAPEVAPVIAPSDSSSGLLESSPELPPIAVDPLPTSQEPRAETPAVPDPEAPKKGPGKSKK